MDPLHVNLIIFADQDARRLCGAVRSGSAVNSTRCPPLPPASYFIDVHTHRFREACTTLPAVQALRFLQAEVAEVADHGSLEGDVLRELLAPLLARHSAPVEPVPSPASVTPETLKARRAVFQQLMEFFSQEAKEPAADLAEVIDWYEEGGKD